MAVTNREKYVTPTSVAQREGTRSHNHKLSLEALMTTDRQPEQREKPTGLSSLKSAEGLSDRDSSDGKARSEEHIAESHSRNKQRDWSGNALRTKGSAEADKPLRVLADLGGEGTKHWDGSRGRCGGTGWG